MKKLIVIAPEGCKRYLTEGKEYEAFNANEISFNILDEDGDKIYCLFKECFWLNGQDWIIKDE